MEEHVYDALKILINLSKEAQEKEKSRQADLSFKEWIKEFCTIYAGSSRGAGHTEAVIRLIIEDGMNIGYFCAFVPQLKEFKRNYANRFNELESQIYNQGSLVFCQCFKNSIDEAYAGRNFSDLDAIVIDNSFFLSKKQKAVIYGGSFAGLSPSLYGHASLRTKPFYFIFLQ